MFKRDSPKGPDKGAKAVKAATGQAAEDHALK